MAKRLTKRARVKARRKVPAAKGTRAQTRDAKARRRKSAATRAPARAERKHFGVPDEVRTFEKGKLALLHIGGGVVGRLTLEPGWRWSEHVKPLAGTTWCEAAHFQYQTSGRLHVAMADGVAFETGAGEVSALPSGHDAWVVGDEPVVLIDWSGASDYARK
jgi:hypothetical protein